MPVSHKYRVTFVHIPKTAGSSLEALLQMTGGIPAGVTPSRPTDQSLHTLWGEGITHWTAREIRMAVPSLYRKYRSFSVIRNPFARMVSYAAWKDQKWVAHQPLTQKDFAKAVEEAHQFFLHKRIERHPALRSMYQFLYDMKGNCIVDRVLAYEHLADEYHALAQSWNLPPVITEERMKSTHEDFHRYYTPRLRRLVEKIYAQDFKVFGYTFEGGMTHHPVIPRKIPQRMMMRVQAQLQDVAPGIRAKRARLVSRIQRESQTRPDPSK